MFDYYSRIIMKNSGDVGMKNISKKNVVSLILIFVSSFAYSALAISFYITSNVTFRVLSDIRVTSSKFRKKTNALNVINEVKNQIYNDNYDKFEELKELVKNKINSLDIILKQ